RSGRTCRGMRGPAPDGGRGRLRRHPRALLRGRPVLRRLRSDHRRGGARAAREVARSLALERRAGRRRVGGAMTDAEILAILRREARPLSEEPGDSAGLDPLLEAIGDARWVLLGEASHGTHEFYRLRAELTRRLIAEEGFGAVAVEADWP